MKHFTICKYLGENVRLFRYNKRLSQKALGDLIGVTSGYFSLIEKVEKYPSAAIIEAIGKTLDVPVFRLFMTDTDVLKDVSAEQWTKFQGILEEVSVLTELLHGMLEDFQKNLPDDKSRPNS